jgi:hypothetical protein
MSLRDNSGVQVAPGDVIRWATRGQNPTNWEWGFVAAVTATQIWGYYGATREQALAAARAADRTLHGFIETNDPDILWVVWGKSKSATTTPADFKAPPLTGIIQTKVNYEYCEACGGHQKHKLMCPKTRAKT